jgi:hypothetical protein
MLELGGIYIGKQRAEKPLILSLTQWPFADARTKSFTPGANLISCFVLLPSHQRNSEGGHVNKSERRETFLVYNTDGG